MIIVCTFKFTRPTTDGSIAHSKRGIGLNFDSSIIPGTPPVSSFWKDVLLYNNPVVIATTFYNLMLEAASILLVADRKNHVCMGWLRPYTLHLSKGTTLKYRQCFVRDPHTNTSGTCCVVESVRSKS